MRPSSGAATAVAASALLLLVAGLLSLEHCVGFAVAVAAFLFVAAVDVAMTEFMDCCGSQCVILL